VQCSSVTNGRKQTYGLNDAEVQKAPLLIVKDKEQVLGLQVAVDVARGMEGREQAEHFSGHGQHGRGEAFLFEPLLQSDAAVEGHERGKPVAAAADDAAMVVAIGVHEMWQAFAKRLVVVEAPLEAIVLLVEEEPT
jgi:hypothetical protein